MTGEVTPHREAILRLLVRSPAGAQVELGAVLDTGFTEALALPSETIQRLSLPYAETVLASLADGSVVPVFAYEGRLVWDGREMDVLVHATEGGALVGMRVLYGHRVILDVVDGGRVTIQPL